MRLDRYVCDCFTNSKPEALRLIAAGLIRVQPLGICPRDPSFQLVLGAEHAERLCEGEEMALVKAAARNKTWRPFHRLLVLNKPRGCVSERPRQPRNGASPKNGARDTVYDLIPPSLAHTSLGAFGRLDKDTTGLLMLGSDGGLQSLLTHPCTSLPKRYEALIKAGRISVSAASKQDEGVDEVEGGHVVTSPRLQHILLHRRVGL